MPERRNSVRQGSAARELSDQLAQERPELLPWLRPLQLALHAAAEDAWRGFTPVVAEHRHAAAPLLHGAVLPVPHALLSDFVSKMLGTVFDGTDRSGGIDMSAIDPALLVEAAIARDDATLEAMAERSGVDGARLIAAAQLIALPLLHACAATLAPASRRDWREHYCPVCGVLPLLVEVLGLDRARQLRCGRCGCAWTTHVLLCPFCGEHEHTQLGALVPEGPAGQICWVENCSTCGGYWKARAVLKGAPADMLLLDDARSLELDLIAGERGFTRPTHGFNTRVRVMSAPVAAPVATRGAEAAHG